MSYRNKVRTPAIEHRSPMEERGRPLDNINRGTVLLEWDVSWLTFVEGQSVGRTLARKTFQ